MPPTAAALTGFAAVSAGQTRTNLILGVIFTALLLAALQIYGEYQEWYANKSAITATAALAGALNQDGRALVTLLERAAEARDVTERRAEIQTLVYKTVGIARIQCGKFSTVRSQTRSVFYAFASADRLSRICEEGHRGRVAREDFVETRSKNDKKVIEIALGENTLLCTDVDKTPPEHFADYPGREYRSFLMVPVRTNRRSYGFLSVDADKPKALTATDVGFVVLMAGVLASAIALLHEDFPRWTSDTTQGQ